MIISFHVLNIRSSLRSAPPGDAFEAKRRKNAHRPTFIAQRSSLNAHPSSLITQRSARLRQEMLSKQSEERTFIAQLHIHTAINLYHLTADIT
ncbi:hypothetical protein [Prevotella koreensis]|uniref:Uncharacterized protein n=1 Tax=Prevotella koreensis TaxID=2490854 RepID=A0A3S0QTN2_9BACT|nr:hypothetical protein [Prevotella koreensis]RUL59195.1 hypothetical protein EHV08_05065 [Prevotella koreensis]